MIRKLPDGGQGCLQGHRKRKPRYKRGVKAKKKKQHKIKKRVKEQWKTKEQRRQWWNDLTPDEQAAQIEKWQVEKAARRKAKSLRIMGETPGCFLCVDCLHRKVGACTDDDMPNGCEYWFSPDEEGVELTGKFNPKYPWATEGVNSKNKKQWLAMIHKKNPWLKRVV